VLFYDISLFLLLFCGIYLLFRIFVKSPDPLVNGALTAVAASGTYILIRINTAVYSGVLGWYYWMVIHPGQIFSLIAIAVSLLVAYIAMRTLM